MADAGNTVSSSSYALSLDGGVHPPKVNVAYCIFSPYFHEIYKSPIFAKFIHFPYFRSI